MVGFLGRVLCRLGRHGFVGRGTYVLEAGRIVLRRECRRRGCYRVVRIKPAFGDLSVEDLGVLVEREHENALAAARRISGDGKKCPSCLRRSIKIDAVCYWCGASIVGQGAGVQA